MYVNNIESSLNSRQNSDCFSQNLRFSGVRYLMLKNEVLLIVLREWIFSSM
jgi:hypothetical protein